jgi:hypothetical protein
VTVTGPVGAEVLDEAVVEETMLDEAVEETVLEESLLEVALSELELVEPVVDAAWYIFKRFAPPQYSLALPRQVSSHPLTLGIVLV